MTEKVFERAYPIDAQKSTFTRLANRFIKEYNETFNEDAPEGIRAISGKIRACEEFEEVEYEYKNEHTSRESQERMYDKCTFTEEMRVYACYDTDEYDNPTYFVRWYFFRSECYEKKIGQETVRGKDYGEIVRKVYKKKGAYRYFCTHRPPSAGCITSGFVSYEAYYKTYPYAGEVTYNNILSEDEATKWGLERDTEYERIRKYYIEEDA